MAVSKITLDTNAYSALFRNNDKVAKRIARASTVYLPIIVLGELRAGFLMGDRKTANEKLLRKFSEDMNIEIPKITEETSNLYAKIVSELSKKGTPIPTNDIWIAAQAIETNSELITLDKHFKKINGLKIWNNA